MSRAKAEVEIRPITLEDLKAMFLIDKEIRASRKAITYADFSTEDIFTISQEASRYKMPLSYIAELLDFGLVAEIGGLICGFTLGRVVHRQHFDLYFLDLLMPELDGAELFRRIRQMDKETPVAIITGYPDSDLMRKATEHGPFTVIKKPFVINDILYAVHSSLHATQTRR